MGGLGQQRPQTARASLVLTPVSEEPTETQGPQPLREPRASCGTGTVFPGRGPTAGRCGPLGYAAQSGRKPYGSRREPAPGSGPFRAFCCPGPWRCLPGVPALQSVQRPAAARPPGWRRPAGEGGWAWASAPCRSAALARPPAARVLLLPCTTVGEGRHFIPSPFQAKCLLHRRIGVKKETHRQPPKTSVTQEPPILRALRASGARGTDA